MNSKSGCEARLANSLISGGATCAVESDRGILSKRNRIGDFLALRPSNSQDVAFITGTARWSDCENEHLWSERVFAVLPNDHLLVAKEMLSWIDLLGESFIVSDTAPGPEIHDYLVQRLADLGQHPEIHPQYVGRDNILSLVAVGRGLTLTSEATTVAQIPGIAYRPIANEVLPFSAVWSPKNDNPACRRLLSLARSMTCLNGGRKSGFGL